MIKVESLNLIHLKTKKRVTRKEGLDFANNFGRYSERF